MCGNVDTNVCAETAESECCQASNYTALSSTLSDMLLHGRQLQVKLLQCSLPDVYLRAVMC